MKYFLLLAFIFSPLTLHAKAYSNDNEEYSCSSRGENKKVIVWVIVRRHDGHYQNSLVKVTMNPCGDYIIPEEYFYAIAQMINITDAEVIYQAEDEPTVSIEWSDITKIKKELSVTSTAKLKYQIFNEGEIQSWQEVYKID